MVPPRPSLCLYLAPANSLARINPYNSSSCHQVTRAMNEWRKSTWEPWNPPITPATYPLVSNAVDTRNKDVTNETHGFR